MTPSEYDAALVKTLRHTAPDVRRKSAKLALMMMQAADRIEQLSAAQIQPASTPDQSHTDRRGLDGEGL